MMAEVVLKNEDDMKKFWAYVMSNTFPDRQLDAIATKSENFGRRLSELANRLEPLLHEKKWGMETTASKNRKIPLDAIRTAIDNGNYDAAIYAMERIERFFDPLKDASKIGQLNTIAREARAIGKEFPTYTLTLTLDGMSKVGVDLSGFLAHKHLVSRDGRSYQDKAIVSGIIRFGLNPSAVRHIKALIAEQAPLLTDTDRDQFQQISMAVGPFRQPPLPLWKTGAAQEDNRSAELTVAGQKRDFAAKVQALLDRDPELRETLPAIMTRYATANDQEQPKLWAEAMQTISSSVAKNFGDIQRSWPRTFGPG